MSTPNSDNLYIGAGAWFIRLLSDGPGERHLGNVPSASLTTTDETKQLFESMTRNRALYKEITTKRTMTLAISLNEHVRENFALALASELGQIVQAVGTLSNVTLTPSSKKGYFYVTGKRNLTDVVVTGEGDLDYVAGVDYEVHAKTGRIHILPSGSIADGTTLTVSASYSAAKWNTVEGGVAKTIEASLRFVGDPSVGPEMEIEFFKVAITPGAALELISEDFSAIAINCAVLADQTRPAGESQFYRITRLDEVVA